MKKMLKKFLFPIFYLVSLIGFIYLLQPVLKNPSPLFSLSLSVLEEWIILSLLALFTAALFAISIALCSEPTFVIPQVVITTLIPLIFNQQKYSFILAAGLLTVTVAIYIPLQNKMRTYLTFKPTELISPSAKQLASALVLVISIAFYFAAQTFMSSHSISEFLSPITSLSANIVSSQLGTNDTSASLPALTSNQIQLLKSHPEVLQQYGLSPDVLDTLQSSQNKKGQIDINKAVQDQVAKQLEDIIKPYEPYIPLILAILFYLTLIPFTSFLSILVSPLIWLIFYLLEKSGFIHFNVEMREVRKLNL